MLKGRQVLVVDDMKEERMLISSYLHSQGCRVYHADDGLDGVHKARQVDPDIVLLDLDMPRCDGFSACKLMSQDSMTKHIPVIFLSAFSASETRVQGLISGAVDYIGKPFNFDEVYLRIAMNLRNEHTASHKLPVTDEMLAAEAGKASNLDGIIFQSARMHLLTSLRNAPGLQELARLVGTNSKQLNASFKACVGLTVYEYLREERMKEAEKLLAWTELAISEISARVGFNSSANFATAFKERFGTSPSRFRKTGKTDEHD